MRHVRGVYWVAITPDTKEGRGTSLKGADGEVCKFTFRHQAEKALAAYLGGRA